MLYTSHGKCRECVFFAVQINTSADCNRSDSQNPFCKRNVDVSNFLNLNSLSDHHIYCLAYVFTYRDFSQGTLGLAWVGSSLSKLCRHLKTLLFSLSLLDLLASICHCNYFQCFDAVGWVAGRVSGLYKTE